MRWFVSPLLAAAVLFAAGSAGAVSISGAGIVNDASGANLLSFDADVASSSPILGTVYLDPADAGPVAFNGIVFNNTPDAFSTFEVVLTGGATFSFVGEATDGLGNFFPNVSSGATSALISFAPNQAFTLGGIEIGDPLGLSGALDWAIDVSGVTGGSFGIELRAAFVPEPSLLALLVLGAALIARRRASAA